MKVNLHKTLVFFILSQLSIVSIANAETITQRQRQALNELIKKENMKTHDVVEAVISEPLSMREAACLDSLFSIDLSIFKPSGVSIWDVVYDQIMDEIRSQTCDAAGDWVEQQNQRVQDMLADGELTDGEAPDLNWDNGNPEDLKMDEAELHEYTNTETLGDIPEVATPDGNNSGLGNATESGSVDTSTIESRLNEMLNHNDLFGTKSE